MFIIIYNQYYICLAPDPPTNLTVTVKGGKTAQVQWSPPVLGNYNGFKLKVIVYFGFYIE